jgi:hypothetical protein
LPQTTPTRNVEKDHNIGRLQYAGRYAVDDPGIKSNEFVYTNISFDSGCFLPAFLPHNAVEAEERKITFSSKSFRKG